MARVFVFCIFNDATELPERKNKRHAKRAAAGGLRSVCGFSGEALCEQYFSAHYAAFAAAGLWGFLQRGRTFGISPTCLCLLLRKFGNFDDGHCAFGNIFAGAHARSVAAASAFTAARSGADSERGSYQSLI